MSPDTPTRNTPPLCIGITLGDPAGVGPEIILNSFRRLAAAGTAPVIFGHRQAAEHSLAASRHPAEPASPSVSELPFREPEVPFEPFPLGRPSASGGRLSLAYVEHAIREARAGSIHAVVTAPVSKESWAMAGCPYRGHTRLFQDRCGAPRSVMMLLNPRLRVSLVTHHIPLREVADRINPHEIEHTIRITAAGLADMGLPSSRIAVAGLNPHAGEEGLLGTEDLELIAPAVRTCRESGIDVRGPFPGDTVFHRAAAGEFDAVVAMYHDQGLAPLKALSFADTVNLTLGLPIVRTSVGHGTGFDIAGRGRADPRSLLAAFALAVLIARHRRTP